MSFVKINAITVPAESGDMLAQRFATRQGAVDGTEGFLGFELLQPTDERTTWLVVTRWVDEASYEAWVAGDAFSQAHNRPSAQGQGPVGMSAEQWSYHVVDFNDYDQS